MRTRAELDAILAARSGTLDHIPYAVLLVALASHDAHAVLRLKRNQLEKTVIFDDGSPVDCRSNIATEMLGRFLVSTGKVTEADANAAFAVAAARGVPLGEILTERKLLTPTELYRILQQNLGRKLLEPFSWTSGTWTISDDAPPLGSVLRVNVPQLIVTGVQKVEPQENADAAAVFLNGRYLAMTEDPLFSLGEVRLNAAQQKVVDAARRAVKVDEIRATCGIDADDLNRILYAFLLLGIIESTGQPRPYIEPVAIANPFVAEDETPIVVSFDSFAAEAQATVPPTAPHATSEEVLSAYLSYRRKDAFELLDVEETAGLVPIVKAYLAMVERFLPSRFPEIASDGLREKAQEVFLAAARAYAELADPMRRDALVKKREKLREEAAAAAAAGPTAMIDPEALWKSGVNLAAAGKLREALGSFELAADCDAQNGTYAAEVAWCRYRLGVTPATNAIKLLRNAIRIDPNSGVANLYAGQVLAALGKKMEGEAYISRAATLLRDDPRPAAAMKTMR